MLFCFVAGTAGSETGAEAVIVRDRKWTRPLPFRNLGESRFSVHGCVMHHVRGSHCVFHNMTASIRG